MNHDDIAHHQVWIRKNIASNATYHCAWVNTLNKSKMTFDIIFVSNLRTVKTTSIKYLHSATHTYDFFA